MFTNAGIAVESLAIGRFLQAGDESTASSMQERDSGPDGTASKSVTLERLTKVFTVEGKR